MSFLKKQYEKIRVKVSPTIKKYGKRVVLTALVFCIIAVVSVGVLWWRINSFSKEFISLPPITDPNIADPLNSEDNDDISKRIKITKSDINEESMSNDDKAEVNEESTEAIEETEEVVEVSLSTPVWQWPSEGKVLKEYGVVLWPTYEDWRMHDGIDIYIDVNGKVGAAANGVVTSITWDEKWGHLIEIKHGDNYVSIYKGEGQVLVTVGENLTAGDSILIIEKSCLMEMALPNHVHFAIKHNGNTIDPITLLPTIS